MEKALIILLSLICFAAALMSGCGGSKAQKAGVKIKNVAVVETEVDARSGASAELTPAEVTLITAELRREAVKNLPRDRYSIMTTETVIAQGSAVLEECFDENCVIALGTKIGADYIVRGTISKLRARFALTVEIYETEDGNLVASSEAVRSESIEELVEKAAAACAGMYRTFAGTKDDVAQSATVRPMPPKQSAVAVAPEPVQAPLPVYQAPAPATTPTISVAGRKKFHWWKPKSPVPTPILSVAGDSDGTGTFTDSRDGKTYKTAVISDKTWMAGNLNYYAGNSWCYQNDDSNCNKYGSLYDWNTAMMACPSGWHLPSLLEWNNLVDAAGGMDLAGKKLKSRIGWNGNSNGTDEFGFSALPGGYRSYSDSSFLDVGNYGYWWAATMTYGDYAYYLSIYYYEDVPGSVKRQSVNKSNGFSVRCVR
jgi:uncharacterized protein (TIGR02145 family)